MIAVLLNVLAFVVIVGLVAGEVWLIFRYGVLGIFRGLETAIGWLAGVLASAMVRLVNGRPVVAPPLGPRPLPSSCAHTVGREPVEVRDNAAGVPEIIGWMCTACFEPVGPPPAPAPARAAHGGLRRGGFRIDVDQPMVLPRGTTYQPFEPTCSECEVEEICALDGREPVRRIFKPCPEHTARSAPVFIPGIPTTG